MGATRTQFLKVIWTTGLHLTCFCHLQEQSEGTLSPVCQHCSGTFLDLWASSLGTASPWRRWLRAQVPLAALAVGSPRLRCDPGSWSKVEPPRVRAPAIVQAFCILNTSTLLASIHFKGSVLLVPRAQILEALLTVSLGPDLRRSTWACPHLLD